MAQRQCRHLSAAGRIGIDAQVEIDISGKRMRPTVRLHYDRGCALIRRGECLEIGEVDPRGYSRWIDWQRTEAAREFMGTLDWDEVAERSMDLFLAWQPARSHAPPQREITARRTAGSRGTPEVIR
jgi:hypothetical protein